jgi:hypothetical protein
MGVAGSGAGVAGLAAERKRQGLIRELLLHSSITDAAKAAGVSRTTAGRWLKDPEFLEQLARARENKLKTFVEELHAAAPEALRVLMNIAGDSKAEDKHRIKAARIVIEMTIKSASTDFAFLVNKHAPAALGDHAPPKPAAKDEPKNAHEDLDGMSREELEEVARGGG